MAAKIRRVALSLLLLGLLCAASAPWIYPRIELRYFTAALSAIPSETVNWDGRSYTVSRGSIEQAQPSLSTDLQILRLAYRRAMIERNPLMDISGTDPQKLLRAVSDLKETAASLATIQSTDQDRVRNDLYPTDFLQNLAILAQDRATFIADGSEASADAYDAQMNATIAAYERDLADFTASFKTVIPPTVKQYDTAGSVVSYDAVLSALKAFSIGVSHTKASERARIQCVNGRIWDCSTSDLSLPEIQIPDQDASTASSTILALRIRSISADELAMPELDSLPLFELATSSCVSNIGSPIFVIQAATRPEHGIASFSYPLYTGDLRFIDTRSQATIPFISYFAERGIRYIPAWPIDYYECPTVASDLGRLRAMQSIVAFAAADPLSTYATGADAQRAKMLETEFTVRDTPILERDALEYAQIAQALVEVNALPREISDRVLPLLLGVRDRSAQFDTILDEISRTERGNLYMEESGVPVALGPTYLFFLRSGIFVFFMDQNPSITGEHPVLLGHNMIPARAQPYTYYSSLPYSNATDAEVINDLQRFSEAHVTRIE